MGTSVSILAGMIVGGMVFALAGVAGPYVAGACVIALAIAGNLSSRWIPPAGAGAPGLKIRWNPLPETLAVLRLARKQLAVRNAVLGISWFWFVGTVFATQLPDYAVANLGGSATLYVFALALFSIGTGAGSMACEKLSARTVEIGLVPLGAFGMSAFLFDLHFARSGAVGATGLDVAGFLRQPGSWRIVVDLTGIGVFTGLFVVPLFALVQSRTPKGELARVIGALNIQNSGFVVAASLLCLALRQWAGWSIPELFLALAIANTLVALWIFSIVPEFLMRFLSWVLVRTLYRLRVRGVEAFVPDEGPALLVCNHVSYMDALILSAAIPRPVRWVMYHRIFDIPVMRWIFRTARAIPIAGAREDPALMQRAFDAIDAALADGELVGIFPEGTLTRDGNIAAFKSGAERVLQRRAVPVVPLALRGMWASMWSRRSTASAGGRLARMRLPRRIRARIGLVAGAPLPAGSTAKEMEAAVRELRGDVE